MPPPRTSRQQELFQKRCAMYTELEAALENEADPLASYDNLVKWTLENYASHSESGLVELLEETVRTFKDDMRYQCGDLRFIKLWILFANHVEKPTLVYAYMMDKGIGKLYALFFEEYAEALEREGRCTEAETVITLGIRTQAKPLRHLQNFQGEYHARRAAGGSLPIKPSPFREGTCSAALSALRVDPLRNIMSKRGSSASHPTLSIPSNAQSDLSTTATPVLRPVVAMRPNPYAHLNAPPVPGKRPEKLRFDLTLLLEPDGTEYCFEEARARHLGLLGKKWPPPPPPNIAVARNDTVQADDAGVKERSVKVDFNGEGTKARLGRRQSVTVTINTKQALEDVFDMYNSPEKAEAEEVVKPKPAETPSNLRTPGSSRLPVFQDENAGLATATKPRAFQPNVDQRRENITPGLLKFVPVATKTPGVNAFTPNVARKALGNKELVTPVPAFRVVRPPHNTNTPALSELKPLVEDKEEPSNVDVFGGEDVTNDEVTEDFTNIVPPPPPLRSFVPFVDEKSEIPPLPTARQENTLAPTGSKILKFQVHRDENAPVLPSLRGSDPKSRALSQPFFRSMQQQKPASPEDGNGGSSSLSNTDDEDENAFPEVEERRFATSGRFANFDVMTPITERTFEFTETRGTETPGSERSSLLDKGFLALDAQDVAEKLAAELQEEEAREYEARSAAIPNVVLSPELLDAPGANESGFNSAFSSFEQPCSAPFRVSDGFTIEPDHGNRLPSTVVIDSATADFTEVLGARTGFVPPNPCNPSDPAIVSKLISIFPAEPNHHDLRDRTANHLNSMQRFADKRAKRGSPASSRTSDGSDKLTLELDGDVFEVYGKLGEGGFGAVFMAKDMSQAGRYFQNDDENDDENDEMDEDGGLVAIKAVRPTNLWESYILRRIVSAVPEELRPSIIRPHSLYLFKDESFLVLDLCQQGTLLEIVNRATDVGVSQPGGGVDELLVMFFTVELLRILEGLHNKGFIHGDLKIDNCLIRLEDIPGGASAWSSEYNPSGEGGWTSKGLKLIDFGRTIDTNLYPVGQTFIADWKTDARDCIEMREGRPWTYQTDYSGLASIVYCMLFGKYIDTLEFTTPEGIPKIKPSQPMKRYWQVDLWNRLFDTLLNPCQLRKDGSLPITDELVTLRTDLEKWIQGNCNKAGRNLKGMLKKIEIASLHKMSRM